MQAPARRVTEIATPEDVERLLDVARDLSLAREIEGVAAVIRRAARALTGADGVTFVLREGDLVHYVDEDAIAPLWKGCRFPAHACISGWAMIHRAPVLIEDVYLDDRIPHDLYRPTFVKSLLMVPVRPESPVASIGAYWARTHRATAREVGLVETLAGLAATALQNAALVGELREAVEARDAFILVASHELRTPLTPLKLHVEQLVRGLARGRDPGDLQAAAARVHGNVSRLAEVVEVLLDGARAGQRPVEIERVPVELVGLLREVIAHQGGAAVRLDGVPAAPVAGDPRRLRQVFEQLVGNALKFGKGAPVDVIVEADASAWRVVVRDRGIGIDPQDHARIFGRFERAVSTRHFGGLGLGLWIVRQVVEAHGGTVAVESAPGAGATFTVTLPAGSSA